MQHPFVRFRNVQHGYMWRCDSQKKSARNIPKVRHCFRDPHHPRSGKKGENTGDHVQRGSGKLCDSSSSTLTHPKPQPQHRAPSTCQQTVQAFQLETFSPTSPTRTPLRVETRLPNGPDRHIQDARHTKRLFPPGETL